MTKLPRDITKPAEKSHKDGLTYFQRYMKEAKHSATVDRFAPIVNAEGLACGVLVGGRTLPDTFEGYREMIVQGYENEHRFYFANAQDHVGMSYRVTREEAEQLADTLLGVWPPRRILCCATESGLKHLESTRGVLPAWPYAENAEHPKAA